MAQLLNNSNNPAEEYNEKTFSVFNTIFETKFEFKEYCPPAWLKDSCNKEVWEKVLTLEINESISTELSIILRLA